MQLSQLRQFKDHAQLEKQAKLVAYDRAIEVMEEAFFRKNVPAWKRWIMQRSKLARKVFVYEIARGENDDLKLVLLQAKTKWGRIVYQGQKPIMKVIARTV